MPGFWMVSRQYGKANDATGNLRKRYSKLPVRDAGSDGRRNASLID